jgi:hypothetical protein
VLSVVAAILVLVPVKAHLHRLYKYVYTKMTGLKQLRLSASRFL